MRKYVNGQYIEMTPDEIAAIHEAAAYHEAKERHRHLTEQEVATLFLRQKINSMEVDDQMAVRMTAFYPEWQSGQDYPVGYKVQHRGKLCRCLQTHTALNGWEPENAPSLWEYINETYAGDKYDPIPYDGNMALVSGHYYVQIQNGMVYLCVRDTVNPVYNTLAELVGLYVEAVR